jgi:hypothetical protein
MSSFWPEASDTSDFADGRQGLTAGPLQRSSSADMKEAESPALTEDGHGGPSSCISATAAP